jgi:uncharacterized SAM-binding protein YcdF (DUF218 family)
MPSGLREVAWKRRILPALTLVGFALLVLCGPVATWLQCRGLQTRANASADAVYMLAGERDQDRRVAAVGQVVAAWTNPAPVVLTGNDRARGRFERGAGRNLTIGEWAVLKLRDHGAGATLVTGVFNGTDGEMRALGAWLNEHPELRRVTLVTSPFHARRAAWRLQMQLLRPVEIMVFLPPAEWRDRAPWTVLAEVAKMARDAVGLADAPFLTRRGWSRIEKMLRAVAEEEEQKSCG